jgi:glycosyltransferase involved in cell wall biosynthesis
VTDKVGVLIPVFNEESTLKEAILMILEVFLDFNLEVDLLIINDGSTDSSGSIIDNLTRDFLNIKSINLSRNMGKGEAIYQGLQKTTDQYDFVGFIDADLDLNPTYFAQMIRKSLDENLPVAIGSKRHRESIVEYPFYRRVLSQAYNFAVRSITDIEVRDSQTGMKLFRSDVLEVILPYLQLQSFALDVEILALCDKAGFCIEEFPIELKFQDDSSVRIASGFKALTDLYKIRRSITEFMKATK